MSEEHGHEHEHHSVNYTAIFGVLCVCTLLSIGFDLAKKELSYSVLLVLVLAVALCKATFVLLYFMHIKFERAWKYVLLAPTAVLACALPFALAPDIAFHYYNVMVPQGLIEAGEHGSEHGTTEHGAVDHGAGEHGDTGHEKSDRLNEVDHNHKAEKHAAEHKPAHPPAEKAAK